MQLPHRGIISSRSTEPGDGANSRLPAAGSTPDSWTVVQRRQVCEAPTACRPDLAPREKEVLIAWLLTDNKNVVARQLHVSPATVRTHLQRIRAKYAAVGRPARTKAALVARALQDGLIKIDDL